MQSTVSLSIAKEDLREVVECLRSNDLYEESARSQYEVARFRSSISTVIVYQSGKVVVQGKDIDKIVNLLSGKDTSKANPRANNSQTSQPVEADKVEWSSRIGSDEVGKGDYFGPMVVASCYVDESSYTTLLQLGVTDSKKLNDLQILDRFSQFKDLVEYEVEILYPSEYNVQHLQTRNVAIMLARLHDKAIKRLIERLKFERRSIEKIVVDQFSASTQRLLLELSPEVKQYPIEQFHKGESDISVATASIIARAHFLREWEVMERKYDMVFPKGASNVIRTAKEFVKEFGVKELDLVAKTSFKTTADVLKNTL